MDDAPTAAPRDPALAGRRSILYGGGAFILIAVIAVAIGPLVRPNSTIKQVKPPVKPVIVARIDLKPVGPGRQSGLAEILRRKDLQSLRVMAVGLRPSEQDEAYQLVLAGGVGEQLLGTAIVGRQRIFIGESKVSTSDIERHRRIEMRRVTRGPDAGATLVLRGRLPR